MATRVIKVTEHIEKTGLGPENEKYYSKSLVYNILVTVLYYTTPLIYYTVRIRIHILYTGCPGRNVPDFGRTFLGLNYIDRTKNTYIRN
jgi:hypothetical protein